MINCQQIFFLILYHSLISQIWYLLAIKCKTWNSSYLVKDLIIFSYLLQQCPTLKFLEKRNFQYDVYQIIKFGIFLLINVHATYIAHIKITFHKNYVKIFNYFLKSSQSNFIVKVDLLQLNLLLEMGFCNDDYSEIDINFYYIKNSKVTRI